jgi:hypothetical protein
MSNTEKIKEDIIEKVSRFLDSTDESYLSFEVDSLVFYFQKILGEISVSICYYGECMDLEFSNPEEIAEKAISLVSNINNDHNDLFSTLLSGEKDYISVDLDENYFFIARVKLDKINCILYKKESVPRYVREFSFDLDMDFSLIKKAIYSQAHKMKGGEGK